MRLKGKTILITGGDGFIGSAIAERLTGDNYTVIYDLGERSAIKFTGLTENKKCRYIRGDVLDFDMLKKIMKYADIVIHMAAITGVSQYYKRPIRTLEVNALGTFNVLKAASKYKVDRFLYCSSSEIYGIDAYNVNEDAFTIQGPAVDSRWSYSVGKLAGEHMAMAFYKEKKLKVTSLRPFNIYGPRQIHPCCIQIMVLNALKGKNIVVHGNGMQSRAWCYIEDFVNAVILALIKKEAIGNLFNIGNPETLITILALAKKIRKIANSNSRIVFKKNPYTDITRRKPDIAKARTILGFDPEVDLNEGLAKTILWYRDNLDSFV